MEMNMKEIKKNSLASKKAFVQEINNALNNYLELGMTEPIGGFQNVRYEAFEVTLPTGAYINEFIILTYRGGAIAVKNVTANSLLAIFSDINQLLYGGYYDEVESYRNHIKKLNKKQGVKRVI